MPLGTLCVHSDAERLVIHSTQSVERVQKEFMVNDFLLRYPNFA